MPLKPSLRAGLSAHSAKPPPAEPHTERPPPKTPASSRAKSRDGKTNLTGYYPRAVKKQLKEIANEKDTTLEDCLAEALNDYFAKNRRPEIAPRKEKAQ